MERGFLEFWRLASLRWRPQQIWCLVRSHFLFRDSCLPSVSPQVKRGEGALWGLSNKWTNAIHDIATLWPNLLPKIPLLNTIPLGVRISTYASVQGETSNLSLTLRVALSSLLHLPDLVSHGNQMPYKINKVCVCVVAAATTTVVAVWLAGGRRMCGGPILLNLFHALLSENGQ